MLRHLGLVLFALAGVFACSSEDVEIVTTDAATETAGSCAVRDGVCGTGCCAQSGNRYDEARDCIDPAQVIGCAPKPASTQCGYLGVVGCAITPAGIFATYDQYAGWEPPTKCPESVASKVIRAKPCTTADAGSD
jgi:hypothetical protein